MLAGIGAVLASPLFPLGVARRADPDVGLHADWVVLAHRCCCVVAAVVLVVAFVAAWRATRTLLAPDRVARSRPPTSPVVEAAARAGMPPAATNGLRMALQAGRGETSVPIRSAFCGAVFGVAGITAVLVFAASLAHLQDDAPVVRVDVRREDRSRNQRRIELRRPRRPRPGGRARSRSCRRRCDREYRSRRASGLCVGDPIAARQHRARGRRRAGAARPRERSRLGR